MAILGSSKWSVQFSYSDPNQVPSTKTISGLNMEDIGVEGDDEWNANAAQELAQRLIRVTTNTLGEVNLIRSRGVRNG